MLSNKDRAEIKLRTTLQLAEELAVECCIMKSVLMNPSNENIHSDDRLHLQNLSRDRVALATLVAELGRRRDFASKQSL